MVHFIIYHIKIYTNNKTAYNLFYQWRSLEMGYPPASPFKSEWILEISEKSWELLSVNQV